jgi:hypothetical protein
MARSDSPEALRKHGYTLQAVKEWRAREHEAGRPSGLDDFLRAHGMCTECGGEGKLVIGVRWRDEEGKERSQKGPVADLRQRHNLENPARWLSDSKKWDYLYEACAVCEGTGKAPKAAKV